MAAALIAWGIYGALSLRQEFNPLWFIPSRSYLSQWFAAMTRWFPGEGEAGMVYLEGVSLPQDLPKLQALVLSLSASPWITRVHAWPSVFQLYEQERQAYTKEEDVPFEDSLSLFLHSSSGARFHNDFVFAEPMTCRAPAPAASVFKITFQYSRLIQRWEQPAAMADVRALVRASEVRAASRVWAHVFSQWEIDEVISAELWRNLGLVSLVVGGMTLVLLASARAALLVTLCVAATMAEVAALMHFWGLTIDTVSCIALVLGIGLCVDYAAHVAHAFLATDAGLGKSQDLLGRPRLSNFAIRRRRTITALSSVGVPVFHGGVSTFLAFAVLAPSESHLFVTFCKIFVGVAGFGMFQGLVLMPVLLSLVGPDPYPSTPSSPPPLVQPSRGVSSEGAAADDQPQQPDAAATAATDPRASGAAPVTASPTVAPDTLSAVAGSATAAPDTAASDMISGKAAETAAPDTVANDIISGTASATAALDTVANDKISATAPATAAPATHTKVTLSATPSPDSLSPAVALYHSSCGVESVSDVELYPVE